MHTDKETNMLAAKLDLLIKRMDDQEKSRELVLRPVHAIDSHFTCKIYGNGGHSGNDYPETCEEVAFLNNNNNNNNNNNRYCPQGGQGWNMSRPPYKGVNNFNSNFNLNQPSLKDLIFIQAKINESLNKKLATNDKSLENINIKIETLSSVLKNQIK
jgi:hypothetical protein